MSMLSQKPQVSVGNAISQGEQQHVSLLVTTIAHLVDQLFILLPDDRRSQKDRFWLDRTRPPTGRTKSGGKP
jgi:hypothetical protein